MLKKSTYLENNFFIKLFQQQAVLCAYSPRPPLGQDTMADSEPVVIASDQSAIPVTDGGSTVSVDDGGGTITVDGTVSINSIPAGTNNIGDVDVASVPAPLSTTGGGTEAAALRVTIANDSTGVVSIDDNGGSVTVDGTVSINAIPAGTNNIGDVDVASIVPGTGATNLGKAEDAAHATGDVGIMALGVRAASPTERSAGPTDGDYVPMGVNEVGAQWISATPSANGGLTVFSLVSAGSTNATNIKNSAGNVYGWYIYNSNAAARKVVFHNTAGTPTAGASVYFSLVIPPTSGANVELTNGIQFSTGIAITTVTGLAANDSAAVAANDLVIAIFYK